MEHPAIIEKCESETKSQTLNEEDLKRFTILEILEIIGLLAITNGRHFCDMIKYFENLSSVR